MGLLELSATSYLALIDVLSGNLAKAHTTSTAALGVAETKGWTRELQVLCAHAVAALVHLDRNELDDAQRCVDSGLASTEEGSDVGCRVLLKIAAVGVAVARGDLFAAQNMLTRLDLLTAGLGELPALLARWTRVTHADVLLLAGDPEAALEQIADPADVIDYASALDRIVRAKGFLALDDPLRAVESIGLASRFNPYRALAAEAAVLAAAAYGRARRDTLAAERMAEAVALAEPIGLRRPFLLPDPQIAIQWNRFRHLTGDSSVFAVDISAMVGTSVAETTPPPIVLQALTERELSVLRYLPSLLKSAEIAADLFLSVNTVKTHQRSNYRKLGVATRREAVESARHWELL